ncbi:hypothetical protein [Streptomyces sp. NPDC001774]
MRIASGTTAAAAGGMFLGVSAGGPAQAVAAQQTCDEPLQIPLKELRANLKELYARMEQDPELQDEFVRDPSGVLYRDGVRSPLTDDAASASNRLLFSVLANEKFSVWMGEYAKQYGESGVKDEVAATDLAKAVVAFGDRNLVASLADHAARGNHIPGFGSVYVQCVCNNAAQTMTCTPVDNKQNIQQSQPTSHGGFSLGDEAIISPEFMRKVVNRLVRQAYQLDAANALSDISQGIR